MRKEEIEKIFNKLLSNTITKCGDPNYKSPAQRAEEFNENDFNKIEYNKNQDWHPKTIDYDWESPQGRVQKIQSDLQKEKNYTAFDKQLSKYWSTYIFGDINGYLYGKGSHSKDDTAFYDYDNDKRVTIEEAINGLSKVINKSPRLQEPCITYRWGPIDELMEMEVGEKGTFKGFQATSFNPTVAKKALKEQVGGWFKDNRGMVRFFNPADIKGMVIDETVGCTDWQSELLIDKGQKYVIINKGPVTIDGDKMYTIDVLLY